MLGFCFLGGVISTSGIYIAYIDGLNLFYKIKELNRINKINLKWLDIKKFIFETVDSDFSNLKLDHIKYFTANISEDSKGSLRNQQTYLKALETLSNVKIIYGKFKKTYPRGYRYDPKNNKLIEPKEKVVIMKHEEKESDVNLGIHIINDCHRQKYMKGIVLVTSDTDLTPVLRMVKKQFSDKRIIHVSMKKKGSLSLKKYADIHKRVQMNNLKNSQFPDIVINEDKNLEIKKPNEWS